MNESVKVTQYSMFIDGEWKQSTSENMIKVINPATEEIFATVPKASREEVKEAIDGAKTAQPKWEDLSPLQRSSYLFKIAELIEQDRERLARILTLEQGKPLYESRSEVSGSATNFRYYAEFARRIEGDILPSDFPGNRS
ncbi:MAG TPA: aldehyde dehydrogenase family protein [Nitrososphaerales archaeon]|nr:aldehyde dehydrogenase family protein [Nitrososphaerales archaeon]